jgi:negative regulator of sigma E activity
MRYLQKFCVDTETSLLLEYTIIDKSHKPIEQFMFTNVELVQREKSAKAGDVAAQVLADKAISISPAAITKANNSAWSLKKTPKGFSLRKAPTMQGETIAEHYILSDGLSSVSIFISKKVPNSKQTGTRSGALNVVTYYKNNFAITLVGAVPKSTLKNIFNNLQYKAK